MPRPVAAADHSTLSARRLHVDAVHTVDANRGADGLDDELVTPDLRCPFCKWGDEEVGPRKRDHVYDARPDSLGRQIRDQHLAERDANEGFSCSYEGCSAFLGGAMHFLNMKRRTPCIIFVKRNNGLSKKSFYYDK